MQEKEGDLQQYLDQLLDLTHQKIAVQDHAGVYRLNMVERMNQTFSFRSRSRRE